jgi:hypothetical protein
MTRGVMNAESEGQELGKIWLTGRFFWTQLAIAKPVLPRGLDQIIYPYQQRIFEQRPYLAKIGPTGPAPFIEAGKCPCQIGKAPPALAGEA